ncbi:cytochrome c oxidase assembly factor 6 homolog [Mytilus californianus]|uniref:cytochrome c oxidase assembly factor 6 homolog n=1 Tax=Mytilus californianus TaxID=6549 RepID=UPI0022462898|nr:cytochrome c oxidase assembly factor 6 homolog [Mytilus californianus]
MSESVGPISGKADREKCWGARDNYWNCLSRHEEKLGKEKATEKCAELRKPYESFCSKTWVKHFDRRREYLKFRAKVESGENPLPEEKEFKISGYKPESS